MQPAISSSPIQPHVTIADVWHGALPEGTKLSAGESSLRREVGWCTALRARPPAFEPLRGGELLLIDPSLLSASGLRITLPELVRSVAGQAVAGVAIRGAITEETRIVAEEHSLALLQLPATPLLDEVEQRVLRYIVDRRAELHERAQDLHRQLSELALAGRGIRPLLNRLRELTGVAVLLERDNPVEYVPASGEPGALPAGISAALARDRPSLDQWLREVPLSAVAPPVAARPLTEGRSRLIAPILVQRIYQTIAEINRGGVAILLVEQNANYALDVSRRGYVLETGRVVLANDSVQLRDDPEVQRAYLGT